jgi:long-chain fatty acid transport protein
MKMMRPTHPMTSVCSWLFALVLVCTSSGIASAQTNSEVNSGVQFEFPLPGARSLALGGAFVAVADDATAALANPAGLTLLTRPEISGEGRGWQFLNKEPARGHAYGSASGVGVDTIDGVVNDTFKSSTGGLSFFSVVIPRGRWAVGFYRHQQAQYRADVQSDGLFLSLPGGVERRLGPFHGTMDLDIVNYGGAIAARLSDKVSIGGGLALSDFSIDSRTNEYTNPPEIFTIIPATAANRSRFTGFGQAYGPPNFADSNSGKVINEVGDDKGVTGNVGVLVRPSPKWSVGGSARFGSKLTYQAKTVAAAAWIPASEIGSTIDQETVPFKVPDTYSVGASFRPTDKILIATQYDFVRFSQMSEDIQEVFGIDESNPTAGLAIRKGLSFPDSNQVRGGFEYSLVSNQRVVALRLGGAFESDHRLRYEQAPGTIDAGIQALFAPGDDIWHVMPGVGFAFPRFQVDVAYDVSNIVRTFALSAVVRF